MANAMRDPCDLDQDYDFCDDEDQDQLSTGSQEHGSALGSMVDLLGGTNVQAATTNPPATSEELAEASISEDYTYVYLIVASDKHASDGSSSGDAAMTAMMDQQKAKVKGTDHPNFKETELRKITDSEIVWYSKTDKQPCHPNHYRTWHSKNLWCTDCKIACDVCGNPCCAFVGASCEDWQITEEEKFKNTILSAEIKKRMMCGRDESTFLECEDCYRMVCPNCSGICPNSICQSKRCIKCVPELFNECFWHHENVLSVDVNQVGTDAALQGAEDEFVGEKTGDEKAGNKKAKTGIFGAVKIGTKKMGDMKRAGKD